VVFFDILYQDGRNFMELPYERRREQLEKVVKPIEHRSMLAERRRIDMNHRATERLKEIFADHLAKYQEGLVLKAEGSAYARGLRWVKVTSFI
jgi:ATP-dependent DNA ligase